ncbi:MAG TPA: reverse transcriptase domain-containing protein [Ktedonobacteraceae bacterium]|nr:reverse transcriptase domain-containing protein [Ktedonobacteraceae bacterium]
MYNPNLYLAAYGKLYRNKGAMTEGTTEETVEGMSQEKIERTIEALRDGTFQWQPVRRVSIPKKDGKKRPLGLPDWPSKMVQEVMRLVLNAYYEPQFSEYSHGFRPERGCHTALRQIKKWDGTTWFIEGDISKCFDRLDHQILLSILEEKIHDEPFIRLISELLEAGYLEDWKFYATLSGTPQGGVLSPLLANIYLDKLDKYIEQELIPEYTKGNRRRKNPAYQELVGIIHRRRKQGRTEEAKLLKQQMQQLPSLDPEDPDFRRLKYVRYADDFLLGFIGPRSAAEEIKHKLEVYLREQLKLELSQAKTLITHARTEKARFLGYEVQVLHNDRKQTNGRRSVNGQIGLQVPRDVIDQTCQDYMEEGKPIHRPELLKNTVLTIVSTYQAEYRGLVEYYRLAHDLSQKFTRLKWTMERSLIKTLAAKLQITGLQVYKRYQATIEVKGKPYKGLRVTVEREGRKPLVADWGGIPLTWNIGATLNDQPERIWNTRSELEERLLADTCEYCGVHERCQVHHVRALKDLQVKGRQPKPHWMVLMAAHQRKTMVVCKTCHEDITYGRPMRCHETSTGFMHGAPVTSQKRRKT